MIPPPTVSDTLVEAYNAVMYFCQLAQNADEGFFLNNKALRGVTPCLRFATRRETVRHVLHPLPALALPFDALRIAHAPRLPAVHMEPLQQNDKKHTVLRCAELRRLRLRDWRTLAGLSGDMVDDQQCVFVSVCVLGNA